MKIKKDRVGLIDISNNELQVNFKNVETKMSKLEPSLNKINEVFKGANAQERIILLDILTGCLIEMSNMSNFLAIAVLEKYITQSTGVNQQVPIDITEVKREVKRSSPANYIG